MKRREITNRKLVSALTIGISAMMAIQTPITAYASDADLDELGDGGSGHESTVETGDSYEPVTSEAQEAADVAQEAVSDSGASSGVAEQAAVEAGQQAADETPAAMETAEAAADIILNGDASQNVAAAAVTDVAESSQKAVSDLIETAENVVMDTTTADGQEIAAATTDLENASQNISDAKDNLVEAEKENKAAESSFDTVKEEQREMLDCAEAINQTANEMLEDTQLASQKSALLVDSIQTANSIDEAKEAYKDLEQLVDEAKQDLALRKALYDRLTAEYEAALKNLETAQAALDEAEERFEAKTNAAASAAQDAQANVDAAKDKVDNLAGALTVVQDKLEDEKKANTMATRMGANDDNAWKGSWSKDSLEQSRETMRNVVINYYIPQVLGLEVIDYSFEPSKKGVDGQEYNYTKLNLTYKDKDGNIVENATKYFNWDSLIRQNYDKTNISAGQPGIVVFEKDTIEVQANQYIIDYYNNPANNVDKNDLSNSERNKSFKAGKLDVYSYIDKDGKQQLIIRDELIKAGDLAVSTGNPEKPEFTSYNGFELTKVIQNHNSLLHDANCLIIASDKNIDKYTNRGTDVYKWHIEGKLDSKIGDVVANSKALNAFITSNATDNDATQLITKYAQYKEETDKAQAAADKAQEKVDDLNKAIDEVVSKSQKSRKTMKATTALGVEDIAGYLGLKDIDEAEAARLNDLSVAGLISELNSLKGKATENAGKANENLEKLQKQFADAEQDLTKAIERLTPPATGGSGSGSDSSGSGTTENATADGIVVDGAGAVRPAAGLAAQAVAAIEEAVSETTHAGTAEAAGTSSEAHYDVSAAGGIAEADAGALQDGTTINDGDVALSDAPAGAGEAISDEIPEDTEFATGKTTVAIAEEDTALSMAAESNTVPEKKSFWWILLIAILGVTGEKMYKEHMEKKKEKELKDGPGGRG